ncbi:hypothetical protein K523DRAFT_358013 [Schizophyllum commune Tattone D]|nr:hypothetical protein K523DRAFT_358013 [Schizophyllum commune Tattone D]
MSLSKVNLAAPGDEHAFGVPASQAIANTGNPTIAPGSPVPTSPASSRGAALDDEWVFEGTGSPRSDVVEPPATQPPANIDDESDSMDEVEVEVEVVSPPPAVFAPPAPVAADQYSQYMGWPVTSDATVNAVGVGFLVTPTTDLVRPAAYWPPGPKYYAVTRGRFVGVFNACGQYASATAGVSSPTIRSSKDLTVVLEFFNATRAANMLSIA